MSKPLARLIDNIHLEKIEINIFRGVTLDSAHGRVFGGQVLAQSLNAALRTVDATRIVHSMHAYFLRPGNPEKKIIYEVDPIRDGKSFTTRSESSWATSAKFIHRPEPVGHSTVSVSP